MAMTNEASDMTSYQYLSACVGRILERTFACITSRDVVVRLSLEALEPKLKLDRYKIADTKGARL